MKTFREIIKESPVGLVGRTKDSEALQHIEDTNLAKEFRKIVRELGGKNVARQLLAGMDNEGKKALVEKEQSIESYLRDLGFKIKSENPTKYGKEIEFFKKEHAQEAFEDLKDAGFGDKFDMSLAHNTIMYS